MTLVSLYLRIHLSRARYFDILSMHAASHRLLQRYLGIISAANEIARVSNSSVCSYSRAEFRFLCLYAVG
jgi:hypothetical protein